MSRTVPTWTCRFYLHCFQDYTEAPTTSMDIKQITAIRNSKFLAHGCSTTIQSVDFETLWNQLKKATISIARLRSNNSYTTATEEKIKKTLISNMPGMWNSCAKWFTSVVEEQADTIQSMRTFLETGTEVLSSPSGTEQQRVRIVNEKHKKLQSPIRGTHKRVQPLGQTLKNMLGDEPKVVSSYVASLATRDEGKNALVLKRTADLRYVEVGVVNVLIVEHFAGKHALNKVKARQWLEELDMLKALSQQRNTCVILSSTNAVFKEAMKTKIGKTLTRHPLLANVVDISKSIIHQIVKEEISSDNGEADPLPLEESSDSMAIEENQPTPKKRKLFSNKEVADGEGGEAHMVFWQHPGSDVTGMVGRCEKVAGTCDKLLEGEVYHYHTKLMKKPAKIGGKHIWHQDYGYWYN
ncbi:hypothetical protein MAR_033400 [Mya arenaria]|uniref:Uncharacterized protein n=1 Tax=Mya arenaria TaxID=6604 RepID=A0ABY7G8U9_MYAAR|nr:hypothetical protein MAR_033400 [Mya arenaria]